MSDLFQDYVVKSVKADSDTCWIKKKEGINKFPVLLQLHRYFDYGLKKHTQQSLEVLSRSKNVISEEQMQILCK